VTFKIISVGYQKPFRLSLNGIKQFLNTMERESNSMQALCRGGCGFYGNPSTDGLCSLCYKEALKKKQTPPQTAPSPPSVSAQSMMETAIPTIPVLQIPPVSASPILPTDLKKEMDNGLACSSNDSSLMDDGKKDDDDDKDKSKKKNRCAMCRKKVGLTGFECRCGGLFCGIHRYSDKHNCSFDYRELGAQEIRRNNPVVVGEKIQKI
jgi:hypothetical protein